MTTSTASSPTVSVKTSANLEATDHSQGDEGAVVDIRHVLLRFRRYGDNRPTLKHTVLNRVFRRTYKTVSDFLLYQDLNLTVRKGDRLGVVGHNGAGKSTLLKMISGIYWPNAGTVRVRGRVAGLIELGAGFNPELSGVENIYLNGAILGFSKTDMRQKAERILDFAGIKEFANTPVKYYSSGMTLRLGFAIATDIDPEILLIDEIFGAGDIEFIAKAEKRMKSLVESSHIMILISHSLPLIKQMCNRTIWIDHGRVVMDGDPGEVCAAYQTGIVPRQTEVVTK